jgi:hypothetical protein
MHAADPATTLIATVFDVIASSTWCPTHTDLLCDDGL